MPIYLLRLHELVHALAACTTPRVLPMEHAYILRRGTMIGTLRDEHMQLAWRRCACAPCTLMEAFEDRISRKQTVACIVRDTAHASHLSPLREF